MTAASAVRHTLALPDGATLAYDVAGAGDALLFVHGFPHGRWLWRAQRDAFAPRWRCVVPDLRGFGDSTLGDSTLGDSTLGGSTLGDAARVDGSMDRYADDLAALLDALGIGRAVVCGLSMGGYVAFAFWRRHAARVRALVLCDTRAGADTDDARARRDELIALARRAGSAALAESQLPGSLGRTTRTARPDAVAEFRARLASAPVDGAVSALAAMRARPDATPTLATITVPTLIIVGEEDVLTPPEDARAMHAAIAGSRLATIAAAGHVSAWERPDAFNAALAAFLGALPPESAADESPAPPDGRR